MGMKQRVESLKAPMHPGMGADEAHAEDYANSKLDDAAEIAGEADRVMAHLAWSLSDIQAWITDGGYEDTAEGVAGMCGEARAALDKYKELTQ